MTRIRSVVANRLVNDNNEQPRNFRSYDNHGFTHSSLITPGPAENEVIWRIGRATAAAPTFFKPVQIEGDYYSDGGMGYNNPVEEGHQEVLFGEYYYRKLRISPRFPIPILISLFLSSGTGGDDENQQPDGSNTVAPEPLKKDTQLGKRTKSNLLKHFRNFVERLRKQAKEAKRVDRSMRLSSLRENWRYLRWAGGKIIAEHKMNKWEAAKRGTKGT